MARDGREALARMRTLVPHLIVLDLRMPEMSGSEFLRALVGTTIPVIIVAGFLAEYAEALSGTQFNVVARLEKPVAPAELVCAVVAALWARPVP